MKKAIVLAGARLATAAISSLTFAEQPYRDNHGHHDVRLRRAVLTFITIATPHHMTCTRAIADATRRLPVTVPESTG
ncbi:hypothetical protein [Burkholderia ambifaria]|uniref:hypothetical protein n=1 Tax=Burkholderia ambifaria TaxID=152480 RepID=UPI00158A136A|nr:hypothetical protein [Burkholderia ambifaria]